jgi:hypothetical protein
LSGRSEDFFTALALANYVCSALIPAIPKRELFEA